MALTVSTAARNGQMDAITTAVGNAGKLRIYGGTRPAGPGTTTAEQVLAEFTCGSPFAGPASGGAITLGTITSAVAGASGTAVWFRITTSGASAGAAGVIDGSVTATGGGGDLTFATTTVTSGVTVSISSGTLTAGNA